MTESNAQTNYQQNSGRRKFLKTIGTVGTIGSISVSGCVGSNNGGSNSSGSTSNSKQIQTGGNLVLGVQADVSKLDPQKTTAYSSYQLLENIYQKLVYIDKDLKPKPMLAKSWNSNNDQTKWTFKLHKGVKFHPPLNKNFTAEDVVYSIERIQKKSIGSPWRSDFTPINNVSAKNDHTVVFKFDKPFSPFLTELARGYILPKGADESDKYDVSTHPVGTGPFKFKEHQTHSHSTLVAFDDYWKTDKAGNSLPYLDKVTYKVMPNGSARITNLKTGEIDLVLVVPKSQAKQLQGENKITFSKSSSTSLEYIGYQANHKPVNDVKFRQAMSYAISREAVINGTYFGYGKPVDDSIPPASPFNKYIDIKTPFKQDLDKAKKLIKESRYNGEEIEIIVGATYQDQVSIGQIVQNEAKKIGVKIKINKIEWSTLLSRVDKGDYQMVVLGWTGLIEPDSWTYLLFHTGEKFNETDYSNPKVDKLLEKARHETVEKKRGKDYNKALNIIHKDAPYTFLTFPQSIMAWSDKIHGFVHYPNRIPRLGSVWRET